MELNERLVKKTLIAYLDRMAQCTLLPRLQLHALFHPLGVFGPERSCALSIMRQHLQKALHARPIVFEVRGELPEDGSQLASKVEKARGEKIRERLSHLLQPTDVRDVSRSLDGELEVFRGLLMPLRVALRALQGIKRAIDLNRRQQPRGIVQLEALRQIARIENAAPRLVAPAGNPNSYGGHIAPFSMGQEARLNQVVDLSQGAL
jgi:hypothetical protein